MVSYVLDQLSNMDDRNHFSANLTQIDTNFKNASIINGSPPNIFDITKTSIHKSIQIDMQIVHHKTTRTITKTIDVHVHGVHNDVCVDNFKGLMHALYTCKYRRIWSTNSGAIKRILFLRKYFTLN